jgi:hypothetical protein
MLESGRAGTKALCMNKFIAKHKTSLGGMGVEASTSESPYTHERTRNTQLRRLAET